MPKIKRREVQLPVAVRPIRAVLHDPAPILTVSVRQASQTAPAPTHGSGVAMHSRRVLIFAYASVSRTVTVRTKGRKQGTVLQIPTTMFAVAVRAAAVAINASSRLSVIPISEQRIIIALEAGSAVLPKPHFLDLC